MKKNTWKVLGISLLLGVTLTGCQVDLPAAERESLKTIVEITRKAGPTQAPSETPPGHEKRVDVASTPKQASQTTSVTVIGALVHPKNARPQILCADGRSYEIVKNQTPYDIWKIREDVPYLMVKLTVTGAKDSSVQYAELQQVVTEGIVIPGKVEKHKGKFKVKHKNHGKGNEKGNEKGNGKAKGHSKWEDYEYVVVDNQANVNLEVYKGKDAFFFVKVVATKEGIAEVVLYAVY
jgi:hypothetical protein